MEFHHTDMLTKISLVAQADLELVILLPPPLSFHLFDIYYQVLTSYPALEKN